MTNEELISKGYKECTYKKYEEYRKQTNDYSVAVSNEGKYFYKTKTKSSESEKPKEKDKKQKKKKNQKLFQVQDSPNLLTFMVMLK